ncbi:carboxylate--amine ligase [Gemmatimonadota bacterium]
MRPASNERAPVLLLGGQENALSIIRSLTRNGVPVALSARRSCWALRSRHCAARYVIPDRVGSAEFWGDLLLGGSHPELEGSVVFACSDPAIEFMATRREALSRRYLLDDHIGDQQLALLDKQATLELAQGLGVPTPKLWALDKPEDIDAFEDEVDFPAIIKPVHSHRFQAVYGKKLLVVGSAADLRAGVRDALGHDLEITVCELIPGPDSLLSSYYTYIDHEENHLFHFTKRVIRRSPPNFGAGTYHRTEWVPETADLGRRFFRGMGLRGLGNIEFKTDPRDGQLKVIECNARFTAAQELLVKAGMDISWIIYRHVTGEALTPAPEFTEHLRLWYPLDDFDSFRDLRADGVLSFPGWLKSVMRPQVFPYFSGSDPAPAFVKGWNTFKTRVLGRGGS